MRSFLLLTTLGILFAAAPVANGAHAGPCWHEYAEAALYGALHPKEAVRTVRATVSYCLGQEAGWICEVMDPCLLP